MNLAHDCLALELEEFDVVSPAQKHLRTNTEREEDPDELMGERDAARLKIGNEATR